MLDKLFKKAGMMMANDFVQMLELKDVVHIACLCKSIREAIFNKNNHRTLINWLNAYHHNEFSGLVNA
jgi:hypothetical protein